jgi:hypothetical protein
MYTGATQQGGESSAEAIGALFAVSIIVPTLPDIRILKELNIISRPFDFS